MGDSVGGAAAIAAQAPAEFASVITAAADAAFIEALGRTTIVAAVVALAGAVVALDLASVPCRRPADLDLDLGMDEAGGVELVVDAARSMPALAGAGRATLQLLADAGMSSLSFAAISANQASRRDPRRHWTSKVDAVEDALVELFGRHRSPTPGTSGRISTATRRPERAARRPRRQGGGRHPHQGERRRPRPRRGASGPARAPAPRPPRGPLRGGAGRR